MIPGLVFYNVNEQPCSLTRDVGGVLRSSYLRPVNKYQQHAAAVPEWALPDLLKARCSPTEAATYGIFDDGSETPWDTKPVQKP